MRQYEPFRSPQVGYTSKKTDRRQLDANWFCNSSKNLCPK